MLKKFLNNFWTKFLKNLNDTKRGKQVIKNSKRNSNSNPLLSLSLLKFHIGSKISRIKIKRRRRKTNEWEEKYKEYSFSKEKERNYCKERNNEGTRSIKAVHPPLGEVGRFHFSHPHPLGQSAARGLCVNVKRSLYELVAAVTRALSSEIFTPARGRGMIRARSDSIRQRIQPCAMLV